jgi:membrane protein
MRRLAPGLRSGLGVLVQAFRAWLDDYAPSMGAALAYYTLFSVAPLLLIVISVAGLFFGEEAARGEIMSQLSGLLGAESAKAVESLLQALNRPRSGIVGSLAGVAVLLVGATTVFAELQDAMDRIWRAPSRPPGGLWAFLRARLLSLGLILGIGFLLIVSLVVSAALAALSRWWSPWFGEMALALQLLDFVVGFLFVAALFAMIYKWMPRLKVAWRDVFFGSGITALLFALGKTAIATYIGTTGIASAYGAAASLVVMMLWVYWSAQIFLLGAEITWVYANRFGSLRRPHDAVLPPGGPQRPHAPA